MLQSRFVWNYLSQWLTKQRSHDTHRKVMLILSWAEHFCCRFHGCLDLDLGLQLSSCIQLPSSPLTHWPWCCRSASLKGSRGLHLGTKCKQCRCKRPCSTWGWTRGNPEEQEYLASMKFPRSLICCEMLAPPSKERSIVSKGTNNSCSSSCFKNLAVVNGAHSRISG